MQKNTPTDVSHDHKYSSGQGTSLIILNIFDSSCVLYINSLEQFSGFRKRLEALTHAPISIQIFRYLLQFNYSCSLGFLLLSSRFWICGLLKKAKRKALLKISMNLALNKCRNLKPKEWCKWLDSDPLTLKKVIKRIPCVRGGDRWVSLSWSQTLSNSMENFFLGKIY